MSTTNGGASSSRVQYLADGVQSRFPFSFLATRIAGVQVYVDRNERTEGFDVTGLGNPTGGDVVFATPPLAGTTITIFPNPAIERSSRFQESGELRAKVLNDELDNIIGVLEQLNAERGRAVTLHPTESAAELVLPPKDRRAGCALAFDDNGNVTTASVGAVIARVGDYNADQIADGSTKVQMLHSERVKLASVAALTSALGEPSTIPGVRSAIKVGPEWIDLYDRYASEMPIDGSEPGGVAGAWGTNFQARLRQHRGANCVLKRGLYPLTYTGAAGTGTISLNDNTGVPYYFEVEQGGVFLITGVDKINTHPNAAFAIGSIGGDGDSLSEMLRVNPVGGTLKNLAFDFATNANGKLIRLTRRIFAICARNWRIDGLDIRHFGKHPAQDGSTGSLAVTWLGEELEMRIRRIVGGPGTTGTGAIRGMGGRNVFIRGPGVIESGDDTLQFVNLHDIGSGVRNEGFENCWYEDFLAYSTHARPFAAVIVSRDNPAHASYRNVGWRNCVGIAGPISETGWNDRDFASTGPAAFVLNASENGSLLDVSMENCIAVTRDSHRQSALRISSCDPVDSSRRHLGGPIRFRARRSVFLGGNTQTVLINGRQGEAFANFETTDRITAELEDCLIGGAFDGHNAVTGAGRATPKRTIYSTTTGGLTLRRCVIDSPMTINTEDIDATIVSTGRLIIDDGTVIDNLRSEGPASDYRPGVLLDGVGSSGSRISGSEFRSNIRPSASLTFLAVPAPGTGISLGIRASGKITFPDFPTAGSTLQWSNGVDPAVTITFVDGAASGDNFDRRSASYANLDAFLAAFAAFLNAHAGLAIGKCTYVANIAAEVGKHVFCVHDVEGAIGNAMRILPSASFNGEVTQPEPSEPTYAGLSGGVDPVTWNFTAGPSNDKGPTGSFGTTVYLRPRAQIRFSGQPSAGSSITVGGHVVTFVSGAPFGQQVQIGTSLAKTIEALCDYFLLLPDATFPGYIFRGVTVSGSATNALLVVGPPSLTDPGVTISASSSPLSRATIADTVGAAQTKLTGWGSPTLADWLQDLAKMINGSTLYDIDWRGMIRDASDPWRRVVAQPTGTALHLHWLELPKEAEYPAGGAVLGEVGDASISTATPVAFSRAAVTDACGVREVNATTNNRIYDNKFGAGVTTPWTALAANTRAIGNRDAADAPIADAGAQYAGSGGDYGAAAALARSDHGHAAAIAGVASGFLSGADKQKLDGVEANSTAAGGAGDAFASLHAAAGAAAHAEATTSAAGFMSSLSMRLLRNAILGRYPTPQALTTIAATIAYRSGLQQRLDLTDIPALHLAFRVGVVGNASSYVVPAFTTDQTGATGHKWADGTAATLGAAAPANPAAIGAISLATLGHVGADFAVPAEFRVANVVVVLLTFGGDGAASPTIHDSILRMKQAS